MNDTQALVAVLVMALVTALLRFAPFVVMGKGKTPKVVEYLGRVLPYAVMGMLVVYCLKGIDFTKVPFAMPEIISVILVAIVHIWKRNTLFSIILGTAGYMIIIRLI